MKKMGLVEIVLISLFGSLQFIGWIMALGGTAKLQSECKDNFTGDECEPTLRPLWWTIVFQAWVLVFAAVVSLLNKLDTWRIPVLVFKGMATVLLMNSTDKVLDQIALDASRIVGESALNAAAAGFIWMSILNFVLILLLGQTSGLDLEAQERWLQNAFARLRGLGRPPQNQVPQQNQPAPANHPAAPQNSQHMNFASAGVNDPQAPGYPPHPPQGGVAHPSGGVPTPDV